MNKIFLAPVDLRAAQEIARRRKTTVVDLISDLIRWESARELSHDFDQETIDELDAKEDICASTSVQ